MYGFFKQELNSKEEKMDFDHEKVCQLEKQLENALEEISEICCEIPAVSRSIEMIKANLAILKYNLNLD